MFVRRPRAFSDENDSWSWRSGAHTQLPRHPLGAKGTWRDIAKEGGQQVRSHERGQGRAALRRHGRAGSAANRKGRATKIVGAKDHQVEVEPLDNGGGFERYRQPCAVDWSEVNVNPEERSLSSR